MQNEKILKTEEIEKIEAIIRRNYGSEFRLERYGVILNQINKKIKIFSKEILGLELVRLRVNSMGIYFGKLKSNGKIHLTIEGSQLVGKTAKKNLVIVKKEAADQFIRGKDISDFSKIECDPNNFVIVKSGDDILGSSSLRDGVIENLLPKSRKILF